MSNPQNATVFADLITMSRGDESCRRPATDAEMAEELAKWPNRQPRTQGSLYNELPPNMEQIDAERWAHLHLYGAVLRQFRQPYRIGQRQQIWGSLYLEWFPDGSGVGFSHMHDSAIDKNFLDVGLAVRGTRPSMSSWFAVFVSFAVCRHDNTERVIGNCLRSYTCKLCGYYHEVDSSD